MYIEIDDVRYDIIVEKKNIKNMYLRVKDDLNIYVTCNTFTPDILIKKFVNSNISYIKKQLDKQEKRLEKKLDYYYFGNKIEIFKDEAFKTPYFEDNTLYVRNTSDIDKWYKKEIKRVFKERLDYIYNNYSRSIPYPSLTIRKMSTRWGVCNTKLKKVTLNSELVYKDMKCLDYVIVHELSHLIEANHSKRFWSLVEENCPDYKRIRKEVQE